MKFKNEKEYQAALEEFVVIAQADKPEQHDYAIRLRDAIDAYEMAQGQEPPLPKTLVGRLELEMFKLHMKQKQFAQHVGIPETRLSEILRGKRAPNLEVVKKLHKVLSIPGDELLAMV